MTSLLSSPLRVFFFFFFHSIFIQSKQHMDVIFFSSKFQVQLMTFVSALNYESVYRTTTSNAFSLILDQTNKGIFVEHKTKEF